MKIKTLRRIIFFLCLHVTHLWTTAARCRVATQRTRGRALGSSQNISRGISPSEKTTTDNWQITCIFHFSLQPDHFFWLVPPTQPGVKQIPTGWPFYLLIVSCKISIKNTKTPQGVCLYWNIINNYQEIRYIRRDYLIILWFQIPQLYLHVNILSSTTHL